MSRGLSAGNLAAIALPHVRPVVFVKLEFTAATSYLHNAVGTFPWGGFDWQGIGALGQIGALEEGLDLSPYAVTMSLSALDSSLLSTVMEENIFNKRATIYIGLIDDNGVLVADPQERWSGAMDHVSVSLGVDDAVSLACEGEMRFFDRANGSLFTDEEQQRRYSGDVFFEFLAQMIDTKVSWGSIAPTNIARPTLPRGPAPPKGRDYR